MPVNKDAMARYRIIDEKLADPNKDYTTEEIARAVGQKCRKVSLRMIQKDIKALEEKPFERKIIRNAGGRGTVKYADQSNPIFSQTLTGDEEEMLREVLRSLGQFDGLENFTWLDLLKKKLEMSPASSQIPAISFSSNDRLQVPANLLGRLFTAITRKKVIRFTYTKFSDDPKPKQYTVYPYQLKQYNDRWYLLCNPVGDEKYPFNPEFIANFPLDRISEKFDYIDDEPFIETPVDLKARFDEIIGVSLYSDREVEDIYFAVKPETVPYIRTKWLHTTQFEFDADTQKTFRQKYPSLAGCTFFTIECRPNDELYNLFCSYGERIILVEPTSMRSEMAKRLSAAANNYLGI